MPTVSFFTRKHPNVQTPQIELTNPLNGTHKSTRHSNRFTRLCDVICRERKHERRIPYTRVPGEHARGETESRQVTSHYGNDLCV